MRQSVKEVAVGGVVFAAFAAIVVFSFAARDMAARATETGYDLTATFNRIDGLAVGSSVRLGGVQIGAVKSLSLDKHFRAVALLHVDTDVALPADTSIAIHTDGLFGSKYLELEPGGDPEPFKNGDSIQFTQDALLVGDLLDLIIAQGRARLSADKEKKAAP
ncbi:outer membrane lipid asymmetry maintenance protein MlaD [Shumkonia mesophila]|uniref:outer membrane lipid asymmetry maintenance protein MlaD n=1 Tax=Shumkonia mesophila TaxID=2838854 RepID=UPI00293478A1|nr:outer membrane lipid asymmetry maintenance protein MlaD [Shumkonia mesophila]